MRKFYLLLVVASFALVGCVAREVTLTSNISQDEVEKIKNAEGNNTIKGSALVKRRDGMVVTCAGNEVILIPVTPYTTERIQARYGNTHRGYFGYYQNRVEFKNESPLYGQIVTSNRCNAQGFFEFSNVADGDYFIVTSVVWNPTDRAFGEQGGALMTRVAVQNDEEKEVVLAP